ncbi:MAG: hypothetical protein M3R26_03170 [Actinomycetota bacterium]|nr:hypothetical protein [Actinomycetota bacterium]MDQ2981310.1 hypothetical protein [Actinomycetota bacterium]
MRTKLTAVVLAAVFCAGVAPAGGGRGRPLVLRGQAVTSPLLGLRYGRLDTWLVRLDSRTLTTLPGRKLALGRYRSGWSFSPDRGRLVFGNEPSSLNDSPAALNGRAFVWRQAVEPGYTIVSLRTRKVGRTIRGRYAPVLLDGSGAPFYG